MGIIKDNRGKFIATVRNTGSMTIVRDFNSGKVLSSVRNGSDIVTDWKTNTQVKGREQLLRFVKG